MTTDFVAGRITQFKREQGFGTITLDDGRQVPFDASICQFAPEENASVMVQVGKAKWGNRDKAVVVKPAENLAAGSGSTPLALEQQLGLLQAQNLLSALTEDEQARILPTLGASPSLLDVLDAYYAADPARATDDAFVRAGQPRAETVAQMTSLLRGVALPEQRWIEDASTSIDDIMGLINVGLRAVGSPRRIWTLAARDAHAYYLLDRDRIRPLLKILPFAVPPETVA